MKFRAYLDFQGDTQVHREGCADLRRLRDSQHDQAYPIGYELPDGADADAQDAAALAIAQEIYADQIKEGMDPDTATEYVTYAPCTTIPNGVRAAADQDAAPAPKYVVHIPTPSTRGHSLENHERRARAAIADGYAVAPEPVDGREHKISRRGLQPCPACSAPAVLAAIRERHAAARRLAARLPALRNEYETEGQIHDAQATELLTDWPDLKLGESLDLTFFLHSHEDVAALLAMLDERA